MNTQNKQIATGIVLNANYNSPYQQLKNIYMYTITAILSGGTPTGTIKLQASNDPETNTTVPLSNAPPTHWVDIANSSFAITTPGNTMWNVREIGYNYVRVVYTDGSSGAATTTMSIIINCKGT